MDRIAESALRGAAAGVVGGLVMTGMMQKVAPKVIPEDMRPEEFVPKKAVEWAEEAAGRPEMLSEEQKMKAAMVVHLGYSALMGALFGVGRAFVRNMPAPLAGAAFGVVVWAVSFQGWMPALGVMERPTPKKWPAPIMGHMVYGSTTALTYEAMEHLLDEPGRASTAKSRKSG